MQLDITKNSLNVYKALANETRLSILELVSETELNITQISKKLRISKAITTRHVQQLIDVGILTYRSKPGISGLQKIILQKVDTIEIKFPTTLYREFKRVCSSTKIGHYMDFEVTPTCGLATSKHLIGQFDKPQFFLDPQRVNAELLWFSSGYISYKIPNLLVEGSTPELLEITLEIASEFPNSSNVWPSDITFYVNEQSLGTWTCPGNFSDVRGFYTPNWWSDTSSQYGLLMQIMIKNDATTIDGHWLSNLVIDDLNLTENDFISLKIAVEPNANNPGGVTLFGEGFGNHQQDININLYYS